MCSIQIEMRNLIIRIVVGDEVGGTCGTNGGEKEHV
jgi:hypothetical protein